MQGTPEIASHDRKIAVLHEHGDTALQFLEAHDTVVFTPQEEKNVVRKIDRVLMPLVSGSPPSTEFSWSCANLLLVYTDKVCKMVVSYTIQFMDKSVMAQAAVYDLLQNLGLQNQQYSWCS
jgi:hypothetical protein